MVTTHQVLPRHASDTYFPNCSDSAMPITLPSRWKTEKRFWMFKCHFLCATLAPWISVTTTNYSGNLGNAYYLLGHYIHIILLNCTTILLWRNYYPYFTVQKNAAQRGWQISSLHCYYVELRFGSVHFPLYCCFSIIRCTRKFIYLQIYVLK